ncbi:MAG: hypothetical protein KF788_08895 [Piscinibacter sp.]|nr:hypothetical protein [Piscinibacter sp.]
MHSLSSAGLAVLASGRAGLILLLEIQTDPIVRLVSTPYPIFYEGVWWQGAQKLGTIEQVEDKVGSSGGAALRFTLAAVASDVVALALQDEVKFAPCTLRVGVFDVAARALRDVVQIFAGQMDQLPVALSAEAAAISATAVHRGETFGRPKPLRNTDVDQQKLAPGDTSRRFVVAQSQQQDVWPAASFFKR